MEQEKTAPIFIDGMGYQPVPDTFSEKFRGKIYFDVKKFVAFAQKHQNEKGYLDIYMMKSLEKGSIYFMLNERKPVQAVTPEESSAYHSRYQHPDPSVQKANEKTAEQLFNKPLTEDEQFNLSSIPF